MLTLKLELRTLSGHKMAKYIILQLVLLVFVSFVISVLISRAMAVDTLYKNQEIIFVS
jgi:lipopolysaccharide export LptBFGC system permease protein LptF